MLKETSLKKKEEKAEIRNMKIARRKNSLVKANM